MKDAEKIVIVRNNFQDLNHLFYDDPLTLLSPAKLTSLLNEKKIW